MRQAFSTVISSTRAWLRTGARTHFETLSDEDLSALDPTVFCAGLEDRVARLREAYAEEIARRGLDK
jgi:hypothetical protein